MGERLRIEKNDPVTLEYHQWLSLDQRIMDDFRIFFNSLPFPRFL